ncbi:MAG: hypothetical protein JWM40_1160 [Frankiales bacterium]|nr:hypothetical protein [Frankiales bacterium]
MTSPADQDRNRKRPFPILWTAGLAGLLLAVGTGVGLVQSVNSSTTDRVVPSSTAPVYGSR